MSTNYSDHSAAAINIRDHMRVAPKNARAGKPVSPAVKAVLCALLALAAVVGVFLAVHFVEIMVYYVQQ